MPWWGLTRGEAGPGVLTIVETPNDCCVFMKRSSEGLLEFQPKWFAEKGLFGYSRAVTCVFNTSGGYVSQAKRYRQYAQATGLFKPLTEKLAENPNVDLLVGAANVWTINGGWDPIATVQTMKALGMDRILFSAGDYPDATATLNGMGEVLTGKYSVFQDSYPPDKPAWANHDGWPEDLVWEADGTIQPAWTIVEDGISYPGGMVCTEEQIDHAKQHIPAELAASPFRARFLDTTTESAWVECYNPAHPVTRTEDSAWRMALLNYSSHDLGMVTGSEGGVALSVPYLHYYEGMLSLAPYRLPNTGDLTAYTPPTPEFLKYQVGPYYRIPLWELVFHECTVSMWHWTDASNKAPEVWDQRDLINLLYTTAPLYMMNADIWSTYQARFAQSYLHTCPAARTLGYDEMVSHEYLSADHTLQRTTWSSGTVITVNFSDTAQPLPEGGTLAGKQYAVQAAVFFDVPKGYWAFDQIMACRKAGMVGGSADGNYSPTSVVNRAQMAVFVARALAGGDTHVPTAPATAHFPDVSTDFWAYKYVEYTYSRNVVAGYSNGTYGPNDNVDRGQMAVFIARSMASPTGDAGLASYLPPTTPSFPDVATDFWGYKYVEYIKEQKVTGGYGDLKYHPEYAVTRDQMAVFIARAFTLSP